MAQDETIPRLLWADLPGDAAYHAILHAAQYDEGAYIPMHRHDFCELMYVLVGTGEHRVSREGRIDTTPLEAGSLLFIRPDDSHGFNGLPGRRLQWMNIAFPFASWVAFRAAAGLPAAAWEQADKPVQPAAALRGEARAGCSGTFETALQRFHAAVLSGAPPPDRLDLCHFLSEATRHLLPGTAPAPDGADDDGPPWLFRARRAFAANADYLVEGLPRLTTLTGVSYTHLARTLKATSGKTPTQYVNDLRTARAALLLTTTMRPIIEIASECGFAQLSYFYRLFRARFDCSPDAYRRAAQQPPVTGR